LQILHQAFAVMGVQRHRGVGLTHAIVKTGFVFAVVQSARASVTPTQASLTRDQNAPENYLCAGKVIFFLHTSLSEDFSDFPMKNTKFNLYSRFETFPV
jgi:hypothetical protein